MLDLILVITTTSQFFLILIPLFGFIQIKKMCFAFDFNL